MRWRRWPEMQREKKTSVSEAKEQQRRWIKWSERPEEFVKREC